MKYLLALLLALFVSNAIAQRLTLREENDVFTGSDNQYTQGLEIEYMGRPYAADDNRVKRWGLSLRNVFYTPRDITISEPQPTDRPWAGLTALTLKQHDQYGRALIQQQWLAGVVGEWSYSEQIQTEFHSYIGSPQPMGWDNQIPNEVIANWMIDVTRPVYSVGKPRHLSADVAALYGAALGTAFIYGDAGLLVRAGWNMPRQELSTISPTTINLHPIAYVFGRTLVRGWLHNVLLSGSFFQDGPSQDLEPFVVDYQVGVAVGLQSFKYNNSVYNILLTYAQTRRTEEFEGQPQETDFGTIMLSIGSEF